MRTTRRTLLTSAIAIPTATRFGRVTAQSSPWTMLDDASGPAARWDHALLADSDGSRLFVFGGRDVNGIALGDFWSFDLNSAQWSNFTVAGPAPRFGVAAATLPDRSGFLLFGGQSESLFYNDLWRFDFAAGEWSLVDDGTGSAPSPRYGFGGAFDAKNRFIISHGFTFEGRFDDTWAFDLAQPGWADISPPPETRPLRRCLHEVHAVDDGAQLLLYAGCSSGYGPCPQGDLWTFDTAEASWTALAPAIMPAARSNPAVSGDGSGILLIGGLTEFGPVSDVWLGEGTEAGFQWNELPEAGNVIAPRSSHDVVAIGNAHYLFGGLGTGGVLADLWRFESTG